jgi:hypothetical protein
LDQWWHKPEVIPNSDPREPEELPGFVGLIPRRESLGWLAGKEKVAWPFRENF